MVILSKVKILANYLPQFHQTPENDAWWGEGYTDWTAVKASKPLFNGHTQPRVPLDNDYYDLSSADSIRKQALLAHEYGISGFAIYHYWFSRKQKLLTKPAELLLEQKDLPIEYLFIWDNNTWKRTWSNVKGAVTMASSEYEKKVDPQDSGILAKLDYGNEVDWKIHFDYLLPFFKDDRYIKIDNKPVFAFFQPQIDFETIEKMAAYWDELAKQAGFNGVYCISRDGHHKIGFKHKFRYSPFVPLTWNQYLFYRSKKEISARTDKIEFYDYDKEYNKILEDAKKSDKNTWLSGFVGFDDTPRRGIHGRIIKNGSPQKFYEWFSKLVEISQSQNKPYIFVTAWNEWGEGAYLEPDSVNKFAYLEQIKRIVDEM